MKITNFTLVVFTILICLACLSYSASIKKRGKKSCAELNCGEKGKCIKQNNRSVCQCEDGSIKRKSCPTTTSVKTNTKKQQGQLRLPFDSTTVKPTKTNKKQDGKKNSNKIDEKNKKNKDVFKKKLDKKKNLSNKLNGKSPLEI